jgi:hypothetical protein
MKMMMLFGMIMIVFLCFICDGKLLLLQFCMLLSCVLCEVTEVSKKNESERQLIHRKKKSACMFNVQFNVVWYGLSRVEFHTKFTRTRIENKFLRSIL